MSTFNSNVYTKNAVYRPTSVGDDLEIVCSITVPNGTPIAINDVFNFCKVGEGVDILDFELRVDDVDTGTTFTFDLGTSATTATSLLSANTVGQSAGEVYRRSTDATAGNQFATTPYVIQTSICTVFGTAHAAPTGNPATDRKFILKLNLFYPLPDTELIGLTNVTSTNLLGDKVFVAPTIYTYGGAAP